jgi:hypothetical protein
LINSFCPHIDLRTFPFDTQTCVLLFESYSHNSEEVTLHWMVEPITLMKQITLPDFDMIQFDTKRETLLYPNGYWDELQVHNDIILIKWDKYFINFGG